MVNCQELALAPEMTVAETVFLGNEPRKRVCRWTESVNVSQLR